MTIREATEEAMKSGKGIALNEEGFSADIALLPTNASDGYLVLDSNSDVISTKWNPNMNDLLSDNWFLIEVNVDGH